MGGPGSRGGLGERRFGVIPDLAPSEALVPICGRVYKPRGPWEIKLAGTNRRVFMGVSETGQTYILRAVKAQIRRMGTIFIMPTSPDSHKSLKSRTWLISLLSLYYYHRKEGTEATPETPRPYIYSLHYIARRGR